MCRAVQIKANCRNLGNLCACRRTHGISLEPCSISSHEARAFIIQFLALARLFKCLSPILSAQVIVCILLFKTETMSKHFSWSWIRPWRHWSNLTRTPKLQWPDVRGRMEKAGGRMGYKLSLNWQVLQGSLYCGSKNYGSTNKHSKYTTKLTYLGWIVLAVS